MPATEPTEKLTYEDYCRIPEDGMRHEVLDGEHVVSQENQAILTEANVKGAPDLVVEVLSPDSHRRDLVRKRSIYARAGVLEYWIVDPLAERIEIFRATGPEGDDALEKAEELWNRPESRLTSPLLEGFEAKVARVFR